jgi:Bacterial PH domain
VSSDARRVYRSSTSAISFLILATGPIVVLSLPALFSSALSVPWRAVFVAVGFVLAAFGVRAAMCAVQVDGQGVRVVNPLSVRKVAWSDIECFMLGRRGLFSRMCVIVLTDGSRLGVWAIIGSSPSVYKHDPEAEGMVDELNQRLKGARD